MDNLRGHFPEHDGPFDGSYGHDLDDETGQELPPGPVGQDERRMQVRAYNFWASLLEDRTFPAIEELDPDQQGDFGPHSVLLDFTAGIDDPAIAYLGDKLAGECGTQGPIDRLSDVPSRSLLSRITDHYLQIIANQAPIGFEAEFVNQHGSTILYRGILLPFSSDDDTIDFIYGVINWKELADQQTTDELMLEIDQALEPKRQEMRDNDELTDWADRAVGEPDVLDLDMPIDEPEENGELPTPAFLSALPPAETATPDESDDLSSPDETGNDIEFPVDEVAAPVQGEPSVDEMGLADWLASARALAEEARASEDRTRKALYEAIGRAYDFSLAALEAPEEFAQMVEDAGLAIQDRAPMTPIVKLVFGADYDKTRLAEFASALTHAHHNEMGRGELAGHLGSVPGGLKGLVAEERRRRRGDDTAPAPRSEVRKSLARKLRKLETQSLAEIQGDGAEFTVLVARRMPDGQVVVIGEVNDDISLIERAAKKLIG